MASDKPMTFEEEVERACADGKISVDDADEIRNFASFLEDLSQAGVPRPVQRASREQKQAFSRIYQEHYPEDYARALAERDGQKADE